MADPEITTDLATAPGSPGIEARWTSSAKEGVGTALSPASRVWFTVSHGILNEVYYPRVDQACIRDLGLIVTADDGFFSEEKRDTLQSICAMEDGVPAFRTTNRCIRGRYVIEKDIVCDPRRDVVLQRVRFRPSQADGIRYRVYALLAPHLVNSGSRNNAWLGEYKGQPMLFAEGAGTALALASSLPWAARSVGYVGASDGWQDLAQNLRLTQHYQRAPNGNVALTGEIDLSGQGESDQSWVLALGFGRNWSEAAVLARGSLKAGFEAALGEYSAGWLEWQSSLRPLDRPVRKYWGRSGKEEIHNTYRVSCVVLRSHESATFPGGFIASLSIPWGSEKSDADLGGYHLVWPRDLAETAGGLLACGAHAEARRVIEYFAAIQEADGHWPQNSWLDGTSYWGGTQLDECAFPALVVDLALREGALGPEDVARIWPMLRLAARFILVNGPITAQDRWEEDGGYAPFTLAVVIASLLVCADLAEELGQTEDADFLRASADAWNSQIESWTYVEDTPLAREAGVSGYYVRIAPPEAAERGTAVGSLVPIRNRIPEETLVGSEGLVSPDALALVRFGLRSADDVRIRNTVQVIDHLLKVDFPVGPSWKRYNGDGYGEHADGRAFDGTGIGRAWPLLTGERAHFELAAGRLNVASALLETLEGLTSQGALLPEQAWDGPDLPDRELWFGKPTGSAMPLVWAHAEHLKLLRSLADGRVFDTPQAAARRYQGQTIRDDVRLWRLNNRVRSVTVGQRLRLELLEPAIVHWGINAWANTVDAATTDSSFGLSVLEISTTSLPPGTLIVFTWRDKTTGVWAGSDYSVRVIAPPG